MHIFTLYHFCTRQFCYNISLPQGIHVSFKSCQRTVLSLFLLHFRMSGVMSPVISRNSLLKWLYSCGMYISGGGPLYGMAWDQSPGGEQDKGNNWGLLEFKEWAKYCFYPWGRSGGVQTPGCLTFWGCLEEGTKETVQLYEAHMLLCLQ